MLLKIIDLSVYFKGDKNTYVLKDMNMDIYINDKIVVIGETGSGKSIMLLSILGLLPKNAEVNGTILFHNIDILKITRKEYNKIRGKQISYVPQGGGNSMNPLIKVGNQVGETLVVHKIADKKSAFEKAITILKRFNIGNEKKRALNYPHTFSGGMRQRALIGMGMAADPELILADEPTKGLDKTRINMVIESFKTLMNKTFICVTHDINFAKKIGEKVCVMLSAYQVEFGTVEDVLENPLHPYTSDIIRAMPENGLEYNSKLLDRLKHNEKECPYRNSCSDSFYKCNKIPPMFDLENGRKVRCWKYAEIGKNK